MTAPTLILQWSSWAKHFSVKYKLKLVQATIFVPPDVQNTMIDKYLMYPPAPVPWDHVTVSTKGSSNPDNYYC